MKRGKKREKGRKDEKWPGGKGRGL